MILNIQILQKTTNFFGHQKHKHAINTLTADSMEEPFANSAAMQEAKVQPVPCVFRDFMRGERSS